MIKMKQENKTQLHFDSEGRIIVPKDVSKLTCKCGAIYSKEKLSEYCVCSKCYENLFLQLNEEDKQEIIKQDNIQLNK